MPVQCTCSTCGSAFSEVPSKAQARRYCSIECRQRAGYQPRKTLAERFWPRVDLNGPIPPHRSELGACWIWTGGQTTHGYGSMRVGGQGEGMMGAHIASIIIRDGSIPAGMHVLHHCDNPPCVRPDHLFLGTNDDNIRDKIEKGRSGKNGGLRGEQIGNSKLTRDQVDDIRACYARGGVTLAHLGRTYGVSSTQILRIVRGKVWSD